MMDRNTFYLALKLTALTAVVIYRVSANAGGFLAVPALAFCCLFLIGFLFVQYDKALVFKLLCPLIGIAGCFFCGAGAFFPLLLTLVFELLDLLGVNRFFCPLGAVCGLLLGAMIKPPLDSAVAAFLLSAAGMAVRALVEKLEFTRTLIEEQRKTVSEKNEKIAKLKSYAKTLRETVALEERNRFSARIHDRLGHGISGSILLLEGARRCIRTDPDRAEKCLETAAENLRGSVDSIREALREERPLRHIAGITELRELLGRFSVRYEIKTDFTVEGDSEKIPPQIWNCLEENLIEAMTNTVKHSKADCFSLRVFVYNKIVKAEFSDNGKGGGSFKKGMGLETMEERTADCGGDCSFRKSAAGFRIINIFRI